MSDIPIQNVAGQFVFGSFLWRWFCDWVYPTLPQTTNVPARMEKRPLAPLKRYTAVWPVGCTVAPPLSLSHPASYDCINSMHTMCYDLCDSRLQWLKGVPCFKIWYLFWFCPGTKSAYATPPGLKEKLCTWFGCLFFNNHYFDWKFDSKATKKIGCGLWLWRRSWRG